MINLASKKQDRIIRLQNRLWNLQLLVIATIFLTRKKIQMEIKCRILQTDGIDLRYTNGDANASHLPCFSNNILHSLFADCTVSANGIKISTANGHYAHKTFKETEFSHGTDAKKTWLKCQGYEYEENPSTIPTATSDIRNITVRQSARITLDGKLPVDFFSCEKHLVSGVTLRVLMRRS